MLLENESGALSRVVGLFSQRGYNIETLNVAPTDDHSLSRLTVTTTGDDLKIEQITKHLNKIIDVVKVVDLTEGAHVERDTLLVKVKAVDAQRDEVKRTTEIFRGQIIDVGPTTYIVQLTGPSEKLDSFLQALGETEVLEVVRSGVAGMARGEKVLAPRPHWRSRLLRGDSEHWKKRKRPCNKRGLRPLLLHVGDRRRCNHQTNNRHYVDQDVH